MSSELPPVVLNDDTSSVDEQEFDKKVTGKYVYYPAEKEKIENQAKDLRGDISGLNVKVNTILNKHHNDYLSTFDEFMDSVKKDLKQKMEQMERVEKEKRKINDIRIITSERDFFRQEAIRLNQLCRELSSKVDEMTRELKFQTGELVNISKKWKESENANKQLIVELERNIQLNKEMEFHIKMAQDNINQQQHVNSNNKEINNIDELDNYDSLNKERIIRIVEKLKMELKKERARNHFVISEFNKILKDREKLESIFIDCVEESRKDIFNRKLKDTIANASVSHSVTHSKHFSVNNTNNKQVNIPYINDVKYEQFLPSDKKKLIESFLLKEEVVNLIKEYVFKKIDGGSIYNFKYDYMGQTKSAFMKTDKMFSMQNFRKKTPSTGLTYTMQIKSAKTPNIKHF